MCALSVIPKHREYAQLFTVHLKAGSYFKVQLNFFQPAHVAITHARRQLDVSLIQCKDLHVCVLWVWGVVSVIRVSKTKLSGATHLRLNVYF